MLLLHKIEKQTKEGIRAKVPGRVSIGEPGELSGLLYATSVYKGTAGE